MTEKFSYDDEIKVAIIIPISKIYGYSAAMHDAAEKVLYSLRLRGFDVVKLPTEGEAE